jgi:Adenylate and Guanylate cyclase catalytic domain
MGGERGPLPPCLWAQNPTGDRPSRGRLQLLRVWLSLLERWSYARVVRELRARWISGRLPGWLKRLVEIGVLSSDSEELRIRKAVLVLSSTLMASLSCVWVVTYAVLGLWVSAAIPLVYQLASAASIYTFARTRRYMLFRRSQLWMSLVLPFALQWSLGGFRNSSAVCLWGFTSPLGALLFVGPREAVSWFVAFVGLVAVSAAIDPALAVGASYIPGGVVIIFFALNILGVTTTAYALLQYFVRAREREQARSERLLLNVLPEPVAARLKQDDGIIADAREEVTVMFADIVGFTRLSERLPASDVVALLDRVFASWDSLAAEHGVEKIKTIGDAYMVAGGIPLSRGGSRRGDRRHGARDGARTRRPGGRDRNGAAGAYRDRYGAGRRRRDRPREVHLRPLGRHGQHCQSHGVSRAARHDPSHRADL